MRPPAAVSRARSWRPFSSTSEHQRAAPRSCRSRSGSYTLRHRSGSCGSEPPGAVVHASPPRAGRCRRRRWSSCRAASPAAATELDRPVDVVGGPGVDEVRAPHLAPQADAGRRRSAAARTRAGPRSPGAGRPSGCPQLLVDRAPGVRGSRSYCSGSIVGAATVKRVKRRRELRAERAQVLAEGALHGDARSARCDGKRTGTTIRYSMGLPFLETVVSRRRPDRRASACTWVDAISISNPNAGNPRGEYLEARMVRPTHPAHCSGTRILGGIPADSAPACDAASPAIAVDGTVES